MLLELEFKWGDTGTYNTQVSGMAWQKMPSDGGKRQLEQRDEDQERGAVGGGQEAVCSATKEGQSRSHSTTDLTGVKEAEGSARALKQGLPG